MAYLTGPLLFSGRLSGMRAYYNNTLKRYFLSTKGGVPREIILNSPVFERTRENMSEFKACARWASILRKSLNALSHLRRGYYFSSMMSMAKQIQKIDVAGDYGKRSILSSKAPDTLPELTFNAVHPFERVICLNYALTRSDDLQTLRFTIPSFRSGLALKWHGRIFSYRLLLFATLLPDLKWDEASRSYLPVMDLRSLPNSIVCTGWKAVSSGEEVIDLTTPIPLVPLDMLLVVALGVEIQTSVIPSIQPDGTMKILRCYAD